MRTKNHPFQRAVAGALLISFPGTMVSSVYAPRANAAPMPGPTFTPRPGPTVAPTARPTVRPSVRPTAAPTGLPTAIPTFSPNPNPTFSPGPIPTLKPDVKLQPNEFGMVKGAIPQRTIPMADPKTGKLLTGNEPIQLPNGKTVSAKAYYDGLNDHEAFLNKGGKSLVSSGGTDLGVVQKLHLGDPSMYYNPSKDTQIWQLHQNQKPKGPNDTKVADPQEAFVVTGANNAPANACISQEKLKPLNLSYVISQNPGTSKFGASLGGEFVTIGTYDGAAAKSEMTAKGGLSADLLLFGMKFSVLDAKSQLSTLPKGKSSLGGAVYVMGHKVYGVPKLDQPSISWSNGFDTQKDIPGPVIFFMAGPIPMSIRSGMRTNLGMHWTVRANPPALGCGSGMTVGGVGFAAVPYAKAGAYVEGGVELAIGAAGVGGQVNMVDASLNFNGSVALQPSKAGFKYNFDLNESIQALSGRFYAFAKLYVPSYILLWPLALLLAVFNLHKIDWNKIKDLFGTQSWELDLFKWNGINVNGGLHKKTFDPPAAGWSASGKPSGGGIATPGSGGSPGGGCVPGSTVGC